MNVPSGNCRSFAGLFSRGLRGCEVAQTNRDGPTIVGVLNDIPQPRIGRKGWIRTSAQVRIFGLSRTLRPPHLNGSENGCRINNRQDSRGCRLTIGKNRTVVRSRQRRQPTTILLVRIGGQAIPKKHHLSPSPCISWCPEVGLAVRCDPAGPASYWAEPGGARDDKKRLARL